MYFRGRMISYFRLINNLIIQSTGRIRIFLVQPDSAGVFSPSSIIIGLIVGGTGQRIPYELKIVN